MRALMVVSLAMVIGLSAGCSKSKSEKMTFEEFKKALLGKALGKHLNDSEIEDVIGKPDKIVQDGNDRQCTYKLSDGIAIVIMHAAVESKWAIYPDELAFVSK